MLKKGQSILEYMIILAVIVGAVIVGSRFMKDSTEQGLTDATEAMESATGKFKSQIGGGTGN
ncbi:MAG: hypothetical protein K9L80_01565 [Candidatus Omnitrophica bacterium]|nr:hypothetical protein [Candidatus Omnitrophota bacterium]MCF7887491.1 hypothetical protein [Candidatus Omnitrophota bacterium]MCF7888046.1 hypothetical protein [Candidatus Omnitrophota bacterium]